MDEVTLLSRIAAGDSEAFEVFYRLYEQRLYWYLWSLVRKHESVEEIRGDVMMAVWQEAARFRGASKASTWLFGIARNKAIDVLRRRPRPEAPGQGDEGTLLTIAAPGGDLEDTLQKKEILWLCLDALPRHHREVLELALFEDLTYREIGALVGDPEGTVKRLVHEAKQQLQRCLEQHGLRREDI